MKPPLLALRFLLELAALAAVAWWGAGVHLAAAVSAPLAFAVAWGAFVAPKARVRLAPPARVAVEVALFALAAAALGASGHPVLAALFGTVAVADGLVLRALDRG